MRPGPRAGLDQRQPVPGVRADGRRDHRVAAASAASDAGSVASASSSGHSRAAGGSRRPHRRQLLPRPPGERDPASPAARARPGARPSAPRRTRWRRTRRGRSPAGRPAPPHPRPACSERGVRASSAPNAAFAPVAGARYTLRRYWPPTSKNAPVSCPSEHTRAARISSSNTFPPPVATSCNRRRAAAASVAWRAWKSSSRSSWRLLLLLGRPRQLDLGGAGGDLADEGVHPDDRQRPVVLAVLVEHRLVLDPPALVAGLHRAQHAAALGDAVELGEHGLLDEVGELVDDERALQRVLVQPTAPTPCR